MTTVHTHPVDFIAELRLRQWARANYVAAQFRQDSRWHPIVLDEMQRKDADLAAKHRANGLPAISQPAPVRAAHEVSHRVDTPHEPRVAPHFNGTKVSTSAPIPFYA